MADILILEPNETTNQLMTDTLQSAGYACCPCSTINEGLTALQNKTRMATVLNAGLPWRESYAFLQALESRGLPVLFITSVESNIAHLKAMYQSDCDVLLTPYNPEQLAAAVTDLLQRSPSVLSLGDLTLDAEDKQVILNGRPLTLTAQEFALLHALMRSPNATLSREELLRTAWGYQGVGTTRTVDVHIQRLRRKMGRSYIETIYKMGYRLKFAQ